MSNFMKRVTSKLLGKKQLAEKQLKRYTKPKVISKNLAEGNNMATFDRLNEIEKLHNQNRDIPILTSLADKEKLKEHIREIRRSSRKERNMFKGYPYSLLNSRIYTGK